MVFGAGAWGVVGGGIAAGLATGAEFSFGGGAEKLLGGGGVVFWGAAFWGVAVWGAAVWGAAVWGAAVWGAEGLVTLPVPLSRFTFSGSGGIAGRKGWDSLRGGGSWPIAVPPRASPAAASASPAATRAEYAARNCGKRGAFKSGKRAMFGFSWGFSWVRSVSLAEIVPLEGSRARVRGGPEYRSGRESGKG